MRALETLILRKDIPDIVGEVHVALKPDFTYSAGWLARTDYGAEVLVELEIPPTSPFARDLRVNQMVEEFEIHAPETAGWLRKETKIVGNKVGKFHIVGVSSSPNRLKIMLRTAADAESPGYNVTLNRKTRSLEVARAGDVEPFDLDPADGSPLLELADRLIVEATRIRDQRRGLLGASLDGKPLAEYPRPTDLVERMMRSIGPTVCEIARHSPGEELVLRRVIGDNRREEVFVAKRTLLDRIAELPAERRHLFDPLCLDGTIPEPTAAAPQDSADPRRPDDFDVDEDTDEGWDEKAEPTAVLLGPASLARPRDEAVSADREAVPDGGDDQANGVGADLPVAGAGGARSAARSPTGSVADDA
jgi:hypothetical protein